MARIRRLVLAFSLVAAVALVAGAGGGTPSAQAYGPNAVWQIALSFNCDNPAICQHLGGFWGWAEFDSDNTGDAQLTGCDHLLGGPAGGAQHFSSNATGWYIAPDPQTGMPVFWISNELVTFTGRNGGPPVTVYDPMPPYPSNTGIPAVAGHWNSMRLFGFQSPPGTSFQIQVVQIPGR